MPARHAYRGAAPAVATGSPARGSPEHAGTSPGALRAGCLQWVWLTSGLCCAVLRCRRATLCTRTSQSVWQTPLPPSSGASGGCLAGHGVDLYARCARSAALPALIMACPSGAETPGHPARQPCTGGASNPCHDSPCVQNRGAPTGHPPPGAGHPAGAACAHGPCLCTAHSAGGPARNGGTVSAAAAMTFASVPGSRCWPSRQIRTQTGVLCLQSEALFYIVQCKQAEAGSQIAERRCGVSHAKDGSRSIHRHREREAAGGGAAGRVQAQKVAKLQTGSISWTISQVIGMH